MNVIKVFKILVVASTAVIDHIDVAGVGADVAVFAAGDVVDAAAIFGGRKNENLILDRSPTETA